MNKPILIYGYGNPGRQDDGLGPAIIDRIEADAELRALVDTESNYQLNVEDALDVVGRTAVIFVDATLSGDGPFAFYGIEPSAEITFTTHSMSPESVMALANDLYQAETPGYVLAIKGHEWDFVEGLSAAARQNLDEAYRFLAEAVRRILAEGRIEANPVVKTH